MRTKTEECERIVLQAMEAIQDEDEETFSRLIYPIPKQEWKQETGEEAPPKASRLRQVLNEINPYGFSVPYKIENLYVIEDYNGRNWCEHKQIPIQAAAEATVYWAKTEKRTTCYAWPISIQCLCIENTWYLNPYWLFEYQKT